MIRVGFRVLIIGGVVLTVSGALDRLAAQHSRYTVSLRSMHGAVSLRSANSFSTPMPGGAQLVPITIDYPSEGSIFPPDFAPPRFIWRDSAEGTTVWRIDVTFSDRATPLQVTTRGERLRIGEIDRRCVAETNKLPELTAQEAASWSWKPAAATWATIKIRSVEHSATLTITGFRDEHMTEAQTENAGAKYDYQISRADLDFQIGALR